VTEDQIEQAFWAFDDERKRTGVERDAFKRHLREADARGREQGKVACELFDAVKVEQERLRLFRGDVEALMDAIDRGMGTPEDARNLVAAEDRVRDRLGRPRRGA